MGLPIGGGNGSKLSTPVIIIIALVLLIVIVEGLRVFEIVDTGHDDTTLISAANILITAFVTAVAAERVANQLGKDK